MDWQALYLGLPPLVEGFFAFWMGAAVGSFVNVLVYRMPRGLSVIRPPSRCPGCGKLLGWSENLPVIGWLLIRGRCKGCGCRVSPRYPIVEALVGILVAWMYLMLYQADPGGWWSRGTSPWWIHAGVWWSLPALAAMVVLVGGMVAAALCDAESFLVPMPIVRWVGGIGLGAWIIQAYLHTSPDRYWPPIPLPTEPWAAAAIGGGAGLVLANVLLWRGVIRRSFADYEEYVREGETLGDYPHARREMAPELLFLAIVAAGALAGWWAGQSWESAPIWQVPGVEALAASVAGILVGGGIVWLVRVAGTLAFGKEAMGLGDVHILAAAGAVLGWKDPVVAFLVAPFPALVWTIFQRARRNPGGRRELPFGPYLVIGLLAVILLRPLGQDLALLLGWRPPDSAGFGAAFR